MARRVTITQGATGASAWQHFNTSITPFEASFQCTLTGGTGTYQIDLTNEGILPSVPAGGPVGGGPSTTPSPRAYGPTGFSGLTANAILYLTGQPANAWRINVPSGASGTSVMVDVIQAGIRN